MRMHAVEHVSSARNRSARELRRRSSPSSCSLSGERRQSLRPERQLSTSMGDYDH